MPFYAIDDNEHERVHVQTWLLTKHDRGNPTCIICNNIFIIVAEHNPKTTHFRHPRNTNCPSIPENAVPYQQLHNIPIDNGQIEATKNLFIHNVHRIFNKCIELIPNLSFAEFNEIIKKADSLNVWGYIDIDIEYIPYILCTCKDYFAQRNPYRSFSFHFVFGHINTVNQLWINVNNNAQVIYRVNRNTQDIDSINISFDLNNYKNFSKLPNWLINNIENL